MKEIKQPLINFKNNEEMKKNLDLLAINPLFTEKLYPPLLLMAGKELEENMFILNVLNAIADASRWHRGAKLFKRAEEIFLAVAEDSENLKELIEKHKNSMFL